MTQGCKLGGVKDQLEGPKKGLSLSGWPFSCGLAPLQQLIRHRSQLRFLFESLSLFSKDAVNKSRPHCELGHFQRHTESGKRLVSLDGDTGLVVGLAKVTHISGINRQVSSEG